MMAGRPHQAQRSAIDPAQHLIDAGGARTRRCERDLVRFGTYKRISFKPAAAGFRQLPGIGDDFGHMEFEHIGRAEGRVYSPLAPRDQAGVFQTVLDDDEPRCSLRMPAGVVTLEQRISEEESHGLAWYQT